MIVAILPLLYWWTEYIYQHFPDETYWRKSHPPPLDFPDEDDTDDTKTYKDFISYAGRKFVQTGIAGDIWYDIKDGKKVYRKFAGVNPPMEDI
jgi:hypothetical protein